MSFWILPGKDLAEAKKKVRAKAIIPFLIIGIGVDLTILTSVLIY